MSVNCTYHCKISAIDIKTKPVMCHYYNSDVNKIDIESFPCECGIIVYEDFSINNLSAITVEIGMIKNKSKNT